MLVGVDDVELDAGVGLLGWSPPHDVRESAHKIVQVQRLRCIAIRVWKGYGYQRSTKNIGDAR